ncbi:hypothetical protein J6590_045752 [Homalodisca vitripennis]|nr:hypothetical protein J6590_045752 [Homalodisca vitripennis]
MEDKRVFYRIKALRRPLIELYALGSVRLDPCGRECEMVVVLTLKRIMENAKRSHQGLQLLVPKKRIPEVLIRLHDEASGPYWSAQEPAENISLVYKSFHLFWWSFQTKKKKSPIKRYKFERLTIV